MKIALEEAKKASSAVYPNPKVGCVIVGDGEILARGFHEFAGGPHAEIVALRNAQEAKIDVSGATMYVTLEPCNHQGKTPPCTESIIESGIEKVVIAIRDPNPLVNGDGIRRLLDNKIEIVEGVLEEEACYLNAAYITNIREKRAFVTLKIAQSIDGCVLDSEGKSKWITGEIARKHGNTLRGQVDAILVGVGTVCDDDPRLTFRPEIEIDNDTGSEVGSNSEGSLSLQSRRRNPLRIIIDPHLRLPLDANILADGEADTLLIYDSEYPSKDQIEKLISNIEMLGSTVGIEKKASIASQKDDSILGKDSSAEAQVRLIPGKFNDKKLIIPWFLEFLYEKQIYHLLVEGGMMTWKSFFDSGLVDECYHYISPQYLGSKFRVYAHDDSDVNENIGSTLENALKLHNTSHTQLGEDVLIYGYLNFKL